MGRPSVKAERREQILDAYEVCVARYGVEGASLERIAELAGLSRPLIRHNIGNRDALLEALVERFLSRSNGSLTRMIKALPEKTASESLIDWLFDPKHFDAQFVLVAEALIAGSQENPALAKKMRGWTRSFISKIENVLTNAHPGARLELINVVSVGITGIYFNVDSLNPLGEMKDIRKASKHAAFLLLETLK